MRRLRRLTAFAASCIRGGLDRPGGDPMARAQWLNRNAAVAARALDMEVCVTGTPGDAQAWVGNHLGYLDIVGLGTVAPVAFVSKSEVRSWPLLGGLATRGGTLYVDRSRRESLVPLMDAMRTRAAAGVPVVFFPEGTSSDGSRVQPFHAPLFAPAVEMGWKLVPLAIAFEVEGDPKVDPTYWGSHTFGPHFMGLLGHQRLRMHISFGEVGIVTGDRKAAAREWQARVRELHLGLMRRLSRTGGPRVGEARVG